MFWSIYLPSLILFFLGWVLFYQDDVLNLLSSLYQRIRERVIWREGEHGARYISKKLQAWTNQKGFDPKMVQEVLDEHFPIIIERIGEIRVKRILDEPDCIDF